jgi:hypothetical protein
MQQRRQSEAGPDEVGSRELKFLPRREHAPVDVLDRDGGLSKAGARKGLKQQPWTRLTVGDKVRAGGWDSNQVERKAQALPAWAFPFPETGGMIATVRNRVRPGRGIRRTLYSTSLRVEMEKAQPVTGWAFPLLASALGFRSPYAGPS